jgi:phage gp36-like protein
MAKQEVFITETDLLSFISKSELTSLKEIIKAAAGAELEVTNISQALKQACSLAYSYLSLRYETPFDEGSELLTDALKANTAAICAYNLSGQITSIDKNIADMRRVQADNAMRWLEDVRDGKILLKPMKDSSGNSLDKYFFSSTVRTDASFH